MGLFIRQDENRSELQSKIIAELQEKARSKAAIEGEPKEVEPTMLENQHETRTAGVVISLLVIALVIMIIFIATRSR